MTELTNLFETVGVGIGLLIILILFGIAVITYLAKSNKDFKKCQEIDRQKYDDSLKELIEKSNQASIQVAKSNQNIADALACLKILVDQVVKKFDIHDERAISIADDIKEVRIRTESCSKNKGGK